MSYEIIETKDGQKGIKCLRCGRTSYHPIDIEKRYCANCHIFHEVGNEKK